MSLGLIILAAGSSSRMGQSKQLLKIKGEPLLLRTVRVAVESGIGPVIVVLGAQEAVHRKVLETLNVEIAVNTRWEAGMGSSIKAGLRHLINHFPNTEAAMIMVCDQPLITIDHLNQLVHTFVKSHKKITASFYSGTSGVPVIFHKSLFPEILNLSDQQGAKKILSQHHELIQTINLPEGAFDLDTPEDMKNFEGSTLPS